jgi:hypothetical protein
MNTAVALLLGLLATPPGPSLGGYVIDSIEGAGPAPVVEREGKPRVAVVGLSMAAGDTLVVAGPGVRVVLRDARGSRFEVEGSQRGPGRFRPVAEPSAAGVSCEQPSGRVSYSIVGGLAEAFRCLIGSGEQRVQLGVRGTRFEASVEAAGVQVAVDEGAVEVAHGRNRDLGPGFSSLTEARAGRCYAFTEAGAVPCVQPGCDGRRLDESLAGVLAAAQAADRPRLLQQARAAVAACGRSAEARNALGSALEEAGELAAAAAEYQRAHELDGSWYLPQVGLGDLALKRAEAAEARRHYEAALGLARGDAEQAQVRDRIAALPR